MTNKHPLDPARFSELLFESMQRINPGVNELEFYEFCYALDILTPEGGWASVVPEEKRAIEERIGNRDFFANIDIRQKVNGRNVLEEQITRLTRELFVGLVTGFYEEEWVAKYFYFDVRGFFFLVRTVYFTDAGVKHLGGKPFKAFEQRQQDFERRFEIGYKEFSEANAEVDEQFVDVIDGLVAVRGTPILVTIAGPTAAGKTEITASLRGRFESEGKKTTSIEMDNFLLDNDYRDGQGIASLGREAYHYDIFMQSLAGILRGEAITIPRYDSSVSSHDEHDRLKPGYQPITVQPADIVFLEGNFPFQNEDVSHLIGIKVVYLTDDPIRLKRKWKRDMDLRKKYEVSYFRNRYFRTQFLRAEDCYRAQMQVCDVLVDTTGAAVWLAPDAAVQYTTWQAGKQS